MCCCKYLASPESCLSQHTLIWLSAELSNNIGISETALAEFIIKLSEGRRSVKEFNTVRGAVAARKTMESGHS